MANEFKIKNGLLVSGSITGVTESTADNSAKMASTSWVRTYITEVGLGSSAIRATQSFTATAGQTTFTVVGGYAVGLVDVYINGSFLNTSSYTATNGTTVVLTEAAFLNDIVDIVVYTALYQGSAATTNQLAEGSTNLYYTPARARAAISLTTTSTSGPATYDNSTGILNIPQYQGGVTSFNTRTGAITLSSSDVTTALTYTPVTNARTLTINGTAYDLSADRSWSIATSDATKLPLSGGALTGALTIGNFDGQALKLQAGTATGNTYLRFFNSAGTPRGYLGLFNTGGVDYLLIDGSSTDVTINGSSNLYLQTGGANRLSLNSTGAVFSSSVTTQSHIFLNNGALNFGGTGSASSTDPAIYRVGAGVNDLAVAIGGSERTRITNGGTVLVNQTSLSAASAGQKMQVATDLLTTGSLAGYFFENRSGGVTASTNWAGWYYSGTTIRLYNGSSDILSITASNGAIAFPSSITATNGAFNQAGPTSLYLSNTTLSAGSSSGTTGLYFGDNGSGINILTREKVTVNTAYTVIYSEYGYGNAVKAAQFFNGATQLFGNLAGTGATFSSLVTANGDIRTTGLRLNQGTNNQGHRIYSRTMDVSAYTSQTSMRFTVAGGNNVQFQYEITFHATRLSGTLAEIWYLRYTGGIAYDTAGNPNERWWDLREQAGNGIAGVGRNNNTGNLEFTNSAFDTSCRLTVCVKITCNNWDAVTVSFS